MLYLPAVSASCIVSIAGASQDESLAACVNSCHAAKSGVYNFSVLHFMPHILLMFSGFLLLLLLQLRLLLPLPFLALSLSLSLWFSGMKFQMFGSRCFFHLFENHRLLSFVWCTQKGWRWCDLLWSLPLLLSLSFVSSSSTSSCSLPRSLTNYDNNNTHARPLSGTLRAGSFCYQGSFSHQFGKLSRWAPSRANELAAMPQQR